MGEVMESTDLMRPIANIRRMSYAKSVSRIARVCAPPPRVLPDVVKLTQAAKSPHQRKDFMRSRFKGFQVRGPGRGLVQKLLKCFAILLRGAWLIAGAAAFSASTFSYADSRADGRTASANMNFRIVVPAIIRVIPVKQPRFIIIGDADIARGYIDLDTGTTVKLTVNDRAGYLLSARYDANLLSGAEVRISNQKLTATSGYGSMRVASGLVTDKLVPIGYRLHLARDVRAGQYRWPVTLAFSLAPTKSN